MTALGDLDAARADLEAALTSIEPEVRACETTRPNDDAMAGFLKVGRWSKARHSLLPTLPEMIARTGLIGASAPLIHVGVGAKKFSLLETPFDLLDLVASRGTQAAMKALRFLALAETAEMVTTWLVWGLAVDGKRRLRDDIEIEAGQPPTAQEIHGRTYEALPWHLQVDQPLTVVRVFYSVPFVRFSHDDNIDGAELNRQSSAAASLGNDVVASLAICGPSPVIIERSWATYRDADVAHLAGTTGRYIGFGEIKPRHLQSAKVGLDDEAAIAKIISARPEKRSRLTLAAARLNTSLMRSSVGDKAIDLSISFETLFWKAGDGGFRNRGAIKYRAKLILGGEYDGKRVGDAIESLFLLRNAVVHGERSASNVSAEERDAVMFCSRLCAEIIRRVAMLPHWPSWDGKKLAGTA